MTREGPLDFPETLRWLETARIPADQPVIEKARLILLDTLACAVAGLAAPEPASLAQFRALSGSGGVAWPGGPTMNAASAAFVGAVGACWHEACEGLARAHGRPGLHSVPVAYALGLARHAKLGEILDAIVWGYEIGGRAGEAMRIRPGLHVDGTWGLFAATAAAARMLGLDHERAVTALAMAACQVPASLYASVAAGCTARNTYAGHAAMLGIHMAEAAAAGITAPTEAFAGAAAALAGSSKRQWPWAQPGEFLILESYIKPWAAVRHVHYAAACALQRHRHDSGTAAITGLRLGIYAEALTYCANRAPATAIAAQFSLSHGTAFALRRGTLGPEAYAPEVFADPEQTRLEGMVVIGVDPTIAHRGAVLEVVTENGVERYRAEHVPGDPESPLSVADVRAKARGYMEPSLGSSKAEQVCEAVLLGDASAPLQLP